MSNLTAGVATAIRNSMAIFSPQDWDGGLGGYAVILDPDLQNIYAALAAAKFIEQGGDKLRFCPFDWSVEDFSTKFRAASEQLEQFGLENALGAAGYEKRVRAVVDCMTDALERARKTEQWLERTFLLVVCADGGGIWDEVAAEAVLRLNGPAIHERWLEVMAPARAR